MMLFTELIKTILKFIWKYKRPQIAKAILNEKSNARGVTIPVFKIDHRATMSVKDSMVLTQKQTHGLVEKGPRNEPLPL
jgi:hypothetical protein